MGCADVIPGVSGGTIALILGIYPRFIEALGSLNLAWVAPLIRGARARGEARAAEWALARERLALRHLRFLACLGLGMATAITAGSNAVLWLLAHHAVATYAFFFGLILASLPIPIAMMPRRGKVEHALMAAAAAATFWVVGLPEIRTTDARWFLFPSGALGICAMVMPGISGSYVLLMLGRYERVIGAVRGLSRGLVGQAAPGVLASSLLDLVVFNAGVLAGLLSFARLLKHMLHRHAAPTLAVLVGVMMGALRSVWPFRAPLPTTSGKPLYVSVWPERLDAEVALALAFAVVGAVVLLGIERLGRRAAAGRGAGRS